MIDIPFSSSFFLSLSVILIVAIVLVYLVRLIKQPLISVYILVGVLIGPSDWNN